MDKFKSSFNHFKTKTKNMKKEVMALYLVYKRPDVPWHAKLFVILVVGYALSPIDLIPDFVPILGYLDDLVLIPLCITLAVKMIPPKVMEECRVQAADMYKNGKPKNWVAGAVIIFIWAAIIGIIISNVLMYF